MKALMHYNKNFPKTIANHEFLDNVIKHWWRPDHHRKI